MDLIDTILKSKYKTMCGLDNISNISNNTILLGTTTYLSSFYVSSNSIIYKNTSLLSSLNVTGNIIFNNNISINSNLNILKNNINNNNYYINNNLYVSNNTTINNNLYISNTTLINNDSTFLSNLNINGALYINNILNTLNINPNNNNINIYGDIINIGTTNSIINILATTTYVATNNININDKIFELNINASSLTGFDIGSLSGFEILNLSNSGFITTTNDATRYIIKTPNSSIINYILTQNDNDNLYISGITIINNDTSNNSNLYITNNVLLNNISINSNIYISNNTLINNASLNSSLYLNNNMINNNLTTILSSLNINKYSNLNYTTINTNMYVSNTTILNNITINSNLNVLNSTLFNNNLTILSDLNINNNILANNNITLYSNLNINNNTLFNNNVTVLSNLYVSNNSIFNNNTSINSSLQVNNTAILNGNNNFKNINILGNILCNLSEYSDNNNAASNIPAGCFYRTGGVVKIRLNNTPPILTLLGNSSVSINIGSSYTDLGVTAIDYYNNQLQVYITSIGSNNSNILISGTSTLVTSTSLLSSGNYNITYIATDSLGNYNTVNRILIIIGNEIVIPFDYNSVLIAFQYPFSGSNILPNIIYTNNPNTLTVSHTPINTTYTAITLSQSTLNNIGFNYNSSWCFVLKGKRLTNNDSYFSVEFDINVSYPWYSTTGISPWLEGGGNLDGSNYLNNITSYLVYKGTSNPYSLANGFYINVSYNYNTLRLKVELTDWNGTIVFTSNGTNNYTFTRKLTPFIFCLVWDEFIFYNGFYYNKTGYVPYSTFISSFT